MMEIQGRQEKGRDEWCALAALLQQGAGKTRWLQEKEAGRTKRVLYYFPPPRAGAGRESR